MSDSDTAILVENISKRYRIGLHEEKNENVFGALLNTIKYPVKNFRKYRSLYKFSKTVDSDLFKDNEAEGIIWPLRGISFEVRRGELIGIIGRNGAGKSTLLKILSRIVEPTTGRAEIYGRVASLLEVGTGFHPELTGRENVFLNGTILGMRKREIDRKFDQVVDFSGIGKFIDTPIKRYSSGMKVRLAFSVAAHLNPEILIIDEVLAVGDAEFQKKCLNKMENVGRRGRTVIFVSHNMQAVSRLCTKAILLENGRIRNEGPSSDVISDYLKAEFNIGASQEWNDVNDSPGGDIARLRAVRCRNKAGVVSDSINITDPFEIEMEYEVFQGGFILLPNFHVYNNQGIEIFATVDVDEKWRKRKRPAGRYISKVKLPGNLMAEGFFTVRSCLITLEPQIPQFNVPESIGFNILDVFDGTSARGDYKGRLAGVMRPYLEWDTHYVAR